MLPYLIILFIGTPILELMLLWKVGAALGAAVTIGLVLGTGVLGASLARREGIRALQRIRDSLAAQRVPAAELVDGALILAAGLLLITPGLLTDGAGFLLLAAPTRRAFRTRLIQHLQSRVRVTHPGTAAADPAPSGGGGDAIDVSARVLDDNEEQACQGKP